MSARKNWTYEIENKNKKYRIIAGKQDTDRIQYTGTPLN